MRTSISPWTALGGRLAARVLRRRAARRPFASTAAEHAALVVTLPPTWNELGYLTRYPDVAREVLAGQVHSGYAHWLRRGYREGRALAQPGAPQLPSQPPRAAVASIWDEGGYLRANPHVEVLLALGLFDDGLAHFWTVRGYQTPRLVAPTAWNEAGYLWTHTDVADAVHGGAIVDGYSHWLRYGVDEGRPALPPGLEPPPPAPVGQTPAAAAGGRSLPAHAAQVFRELADVARERAARDEPFREDA